METHVISRRLMLHATLAGGFSPSMAFSQTLQVPSLQVPSRVDGTPAGTVMTKEYVELVGRLAYLWGWPLVNNLNRALAVAKLPEPGRIGGVIPASPPGQISMLTDYIDSAEHFVT